MEEAKAQKKHYIRVWLVTGRDIILKLDGATIRMLLFITMSGMVRYGENTFMLSTIEKKSIMESLKMTQDTMYRHLRKLKKAGVVEKINHGCYMIRKDVIEYGQSKNDWYAGKQ